MKKSFNLTLINIKVLETGNITPKTPKTEIINFFYNYGDFGFSILENFQKVELFEKGFRIIVFITNFFF